MHYLFMRTSNISTLFTISHEIHLRIDSSHRECVRNNVTKKQRISIPSHKHSKTFSEYEIIHSWKMEKDKGKNLFICRELSQFSASSDDCTASLVEISYDFDFERGKYKVAGDLRRSESLSRTKPGYVRRVSDLWNEIY